ncbi:hypothetical protein H0V99_02145 [Candidatus Saccharibacteria bacterium]|nr:hypothetical protein [Candidatus Saccharibacteria bacterium]
MDKRTEYYEPRPKAPIKAWHVGAVVTGLVAWGSATHAKNLWNIEKKEAANGVSYWALSGPSAPNDDVRQHAVMPSELQLFLRTSASTEPMCADNEAGSIEVKDNDNKEQYKVCIDAGTITIDKSNPTRITAGVRLDPVPEDQEEAPVLLKTFETFVDQCYSAKAGITESFDQALSEEYGEAFAGQFDLTISIGRNVRQDPCGEES